MSHGSPQVHTCRTGNYSRPLRRPFTNRSPRAVRRSCSAQQPAERAPAGHSAQQHGPHRGLLFGISLAAAAAVASASAFLGPVPAVGAITNEQLVFLEAWRAVDRAYFDKTFNGQPWFKVREQALKSEAMGDREETYDAIRRMVAKLGDPYTRFLEPARYAALKRGNAGSLTGVGVEVGYASDGKSLVVVAPSAGGPAEKGGVRAGDAIVAVDGRPAGDISLYDIGALLQGPNDSQVTLTLQAPSGGGAREVKLTRQPITFNPVTSDLCGVPAGGGAKTGYIRIATFSKQTPDGVRAAIKSLRAAGAERYVVDIRSNGGGSFPAGIEVARMWLNDGDIVLIADSAGVRDSYEADGTAVAAAPMAVVVDRGTASASEVVAGALQDNGRARVVGERTFGKGLIQTVVELSDGSAVAVTVSRYQTPAGVDINKKGITPDIALSADALPPPGSPGGFCPTFTAKDAPDLFK